MEKAALGFAKIAMSRFSSIIRSHSGSDGRKWKNSLCGHGGRDIVAHRDELQREVVGSRLWRRVRPHDPPGQKPLRKRLIENPDFAGVLMLVRPMAINYSLWFMVVVRARNVLPPPAQDLARIASPSSDHR